MQVISKKAGFAPRGALRLCCLALFVLTSFFHAEAALYAQTSGGEDGSLPSAEQADSGTDGSARTSVREEDILIPYDDADTQTGTAQAGQASSGGGALVRLVVVVLLLCVACYFILKFLKKSSGADADDPFLRNVASLPLAPGKSVSVVTVGEQAFLLGLADHSVSLIAELSDAELIDRMNLHADIASQNRKSFVEMLADLLPKSLRGNNGGAEGSSFASSVSSTGAAADFLRRSRGRLHASQGVSPADASGASPERAESGGSGTESKNGGDA